MERRRLENRSRPEGSGYARDGAASGAETSWLYPARRGAAWSSGIIGSVRVQCFRQVGIRPGGDFIRWKVSKEASPQQGGVRDRFRRGFLTSEIAMVATFIFNETLDSIPPNPLIGLRIGRGVDPKNPLGFRFATLRQMGIWGGSGHLVTCGTVSL